MNFKCIICGNDPKFRDANMDELKTKVADIIITLGYTIWSDENEIDLQTREADEIQNPLIFHSIECMEKARQILLDYLKK